MIMKKCQLHIIVLNKPILLFMLAVRSSKAAIWDDIFCTPTFPLKQVWHFNLIGRMKYIHNFCIYLSITTHSIRNSGSFFEKFFNLLHVVGVAFGNWFKISALDLK